MVVKIDDSWKIRLGGEFDKEYFEGLAGFVKNEYSAYTVYPKGSNIFRAFDLCRFDDLKVVILGQDPYHEPNQAHGLCFSVNNGVQLPPSLQNIYKELRDDLGIVFNDNGDLSGWAEQGVLLLNATLTVRAHQAGSHQNKGWEVFTDKIVHLIAEEKQNVVFILWGSYAQQKACFVDPSKHLLLKSPHPSPLSAHRGFFGNHHFSKCNEYLVNSGKTPIDWGRGLVNF